MIKIEELIKLGIGSALLAKEKLEEFIEEAKKRVLSLRPDLIPLELAKEFEKFQDKVEPLSFDKMKIVLEEELEKPYTDWT